MGSLLLGCVVMSLALVIVAINHRRELPKRNLNTMPTCKPESVFLRPGWPAWTVCGDSNGYDTCWRAASHTGRHCAWDLKTGQVTAVWPCTQLRAITAKPHQAEP